MVDLHVHSNRSDGSFSPTELVDYAIEKGLSAFALTDHDTVDGLEEAIVYANKLRQEYMNSQSDIDSEAYSHGDATTNKENCNCPIPEVIPGIEFSTEYQGRDVHVVGLYIDYRNADFVKQLKAFVDSRDVRNEKMCGLLQEHGVDITYEQLLAEFPDAVITRAHYAKFLLNHGYVKSMNEAFDRYVGDHAPCFLPREKVTPVQAVKLVLEAGGVPILAHPILYRMSDARLEGLVAELKEAGLMGIEAVYSTYNSGEERQIRSLAAKYRLLISGGSDFHGANKPGLDLGVGYGSLHVYDSVLADINASRKNLLFTDMDGTLLESTSTVSPAMREALNRMTAAGHHLILSSGRPLPSILEVREQSGITYQNMLIISNNGALVYDCDAKRPILECRINHEDITYIIAKAEEMGIHIHGYTTEKIVCHELNAELRFYTGRIHMPLQCVEDIAAALPDGSYKLQAIHLTDKHRLEELREALLSDKEYQLGERVQMIFSNEQYLEILPVEAGKGNALHFVTNYLPALHSHTFAAGDAENDISMLEAAHIGIAMANASEEVKQCADIVTVGTNDEDGLIEILDKYFV